MKVETKYKVGDRVRVRKDLECGKFYSAEHDEDVRDVVVEAMMRFTGKCVTISDIDDLGKYSIHGSIYSWTDEMFEELKSEQTVVIFRDGNRVIAYDKGTKKRAEAKCNPEDAFDFGTGAKLALNRLLDMSHGFRLNDIVIGTKAAGRRYCITGTGFIARVIDVSNSGNMIKIEALNGRGGAYLVDPQYFRLATDEDITLTEIRDLLERK